MSDLSVWALPVPTTAESDDLDLTVLDGQERRRLAAFRRSADRRRYAFAHTALRMVLGQLLDTAPEALRFDREPCPRCRGPHGRPVVAGGLEGVHFSLSHGGDMAFIGVASVDVGVDVETVPSIAVAEELTPLLHPAEQRDIRPDTPAADFARQWTRKEAYLKGLGIGLSRDLHADDTSSSPPGWRINDLPAPAGYAAAVALRTASRPRLVLHRSLDGAGTGFRQLPHSTRAERRELQLPATVPLEPRRRGGGGAP
ncbi:4'-phosphopantetheinyl transferase superfamily protein [Streptomyces sp. NPDC051940]|uniref:4'-phosphopantetheinyl transferase family protein n=1 Tax=Streptomyces sp. NPDC051940 TaxID=3155675 RepID=UPI00342AD22F